MQYQVSFTFTHPKRRDIFISECQKKLEESTRTEEAKLTIGRKGSTFYEVKVDIRTQTPHGIVLYPKGMVFGQYDAFNIFMTSFARKIYNGYRIPIHSILNIRDNLGKDVLFEVADFTFAIHFLNPNRELGIAMVNNINKFTPPKYDIETDEADANMAYKGIHKAKLIVEDNDLENSFDVLIDIDKLIIYNNDRVEPVSYEGLMNNFGMKVNKPRGGHRISNIKAKIGEWGSYIVALLQPVNGQVNASVRFDCWEGENGFLEYAFVNKIDINIKVNDNRELPTKRRIKARFLHKLRRR
jgi:hypothetical protein